MDKSLKNPFNGQASTPAETSTEAQNSHDAASSNDIPDPEEHVSMDELKTKAIEVNSADEVRQAIKAAMSGKAPQIQSESPATDPINATTDRAPEEIEVRIPNEYKPESGDQLLVPQQDKTRKRRGRPQKAGPSKRAKRVTVEDFYVGKLSNVANFPSLKSNRPRQTESESDMSIYAPYVPNQWLRMRFYK